MNMDNFRELSWTDYLLYAVMDPRELYRRIRQGGRDVLAPSFIIPAFVSFCEVIILSLNGRATGFFYYKISYGWILVLLTMLLKTGVYSALIDSSAQFFGQKGNIRETLSLINISMFPWTFFLPVFYMVSITDFMPGFFYVFLSFVFFCWSLFIIVQGISEMYSVPSARAAGIVIMPAIIIGVVLFFILVALMFSLAGYISA